MIALFWLVFLGRVLRAADDAQLRRRARGAILYPGDRVRIVTDWKSSFNGMRGQVVTPGARPLVHLDGDRDPTLFFVGEVFLDDEAPR